MTYFWAKFRILKKSHLFYVASRQVILHVCNVKKKKKNHCTCTCSTLKQTQPRDKDVP